MIFKIRCIRDLAKKPKKTTQKERVLGTASFRETEWIGYYLVSSFFRTLYMNECVCVHTRTHMGVGVSAPTCIWAICIYM